MMSRYYFENILTCEMCGDNSANHKVLGQRLNQSQGLAPRKKIGITVSIKKCSKCGLVYSTPQPKPFDIQDHYGIPPDSYWKPAYFEIEGNYFSNQIKEAKKLLNYSVDVKALDVGAGLGKAMLSLEKAGFEAYGLEPSKPFYDRAISTMGVKKDRLQLGAIEEVEYSCDFFDFITFGAVFEHLYHPAASLERCLHWLKRTGVVHIEVPSSRWLLGRIINFYYKAIGTSYVTNLSPMHVPFHLYEFSLKSFELLGEKLGFSVVSYRYDVCELSPFPKILHPILRSLMSMTNTGMQLTVYLKKR